MRKFIVLSGAFALAAVIFSFASNDNSVVGHWTITDKKSGTKTIIDFRTNGTMKAAIPKEHFSVEGHYKLNANILSMVDSTCGKNYWGKYKVKFLSNDSFYTESIEDACMGRKSCMEKATLVKNK